MQGLVTPTNSFLYLSTGWFGLHFSVGAFYDSFSVMLIPGLGLGTMTMLVDNDNARLNRSYGWFIDLFEFGLPDISNSIVTSTL